MRRAGTPKTQHAAYPPGRNAPCACGSGRKYKLCCHRASAPFSAQTSSPALDRKPLGVATISGSPRCAAPPAAEAELQRGNALLAVGRPQEALKALAKALQLHPDYPEAINSMGCTLAGVGEHARAVVCYAKSLQLWPGNALAFSNMGSSLQALGRTEDAIESLGAAVALDPNLGHAFVNLSQCFYAAGRYQETIDASARALALLPDFVEVVLNGGSALKRQGRFAEAAALFEQAAALRPADPRYLLNLAEALREQGRIADVVATLQRALEVQPDCALAYSNLLYTHAFTRDITPAEELHLARGWELAIVPEPLRRQAEALRTTPGALARASRHGRRLRLGVVSSELGTHAVAEFLEPLLAHLDRDRFHLTVFPTAGRFDGRATHLRGLADNVVSLVGSPDDAATQRVRNESIDVLLDTSGHTANNRLGLFARRAAPVQCTYIGYWSTTGLTEMDWFLSDQDAPEHAQEGFSEGLWRLPRLAVAYHGDRSLRNDLWAPCPDGTVRLGSFNRLSKIREDTLALWAETLKAVPHSRLILEDQGTHQGETHSRIRSTLQQHGVEPGRVSFIPYEPGHERHMNLYNRIDVALDTIPFNSGTTAFDALWMGVPLVTLDGNWIGGRMAGSILRALGRREWIASDQAQFAHIVHQLTADPERLQGIRQNLREEMAASVLCDGAGLSASLADAFEAMYDRWWAGQLQPKPRSGDSAQISFAAAGR